MTISDPRDRFQQDSDRCARFRPRYPETLVRAIATRIAAARAVNALLARHGEPRACARPDYVAELTVLGAVETLRDRITLRLSPEHSAGLALSSSHARQAVETLGRTQAAAMPREIGAPFAEHDGLIPYGYVFQVFVAAV